MQLVRVLEVGPRLEQAARKLVIVAVGVAHHRLTQFEAHLDAEISGGEACCNGEIRVGIRAGKPVLDAARGGRENGTRRPAERLSWPHSTLIGAAPPGTRRR